MRRTVSNARGCPLLAMAPTFHITALLGIEIGGPDEKQAPIVIALCEVCQHRLVHVAGDGLEQRGIVGHRVVEQCGGEGTLQEHAVWREFGIDGTQLRIVAGAEIGEGSDERAGADAGHQLEHRPRAVL